MTTETQIAAREHLRRRLDGWANAFTGLGTSRDKRMAGDVGEFVRVPFETLADLYRSDPFAARIVERPVEEMLREWCEVKIADEPEAARAIEEWLEEIKAPASFRQALDWRRAYGGAGIILGVNKGVASPEELAAPLDPGSIQTIDHLIVFASRELQAVAYYSDPMQPNFGLPAAYRVVPQVPFGLNGEGVANMGATMPITAAPGTPAPAMPWALMPEIHESRILCFDGMIATRRQRLENWGWGDGILQRCFETLRDFAQTNGAAWHLIQDFSQGILSIPGLVDALAGDGAETMRGRVEMLDTMRSIARMLVLDGGDTTGAGKEEFRRDVSSLTSIPDLLDRVAFQLAAAADMPVSLLMGTQLGSGGLGGKADADARNWYDHVKDLQRTQAQPQLRRLISLGMAASKGPTGGKVFPTCAIAWRPLWQLDEVQQSAVRLNTAQADEKMIGLGVLTPEEVRESRFGGVEYTLETQLDREGREAFEDVDPEVDPKDPSLQAADPEKVAAGEVPAEGAASADLQSLAMNGAQVAGLLAITAAVRDGSLPLESATIAICAAFPYSFDEAKARALLSPIEVKEPPPPPDPLELAKAKAAGAPAPFGGAKPGAPAGKPPEAPPVKATP